MFTALFAELIADTKLVLFTADKVDATDTNWVGLRGTVVPEIETVITTEYAGDVAAFADAIALTKVLLSVDARVEAILERVDDDNVLVEPLTETAKTTEEADV